jgi:DNA-binding NtrC family response regulator
MKATILVVNEDEETRGLVKVVLTREGYEVFGAESGEQAIGLLHTVVPDMIICDEIISFGKGDFLEFVVGSSTMNGIPLIIIPKGEMLAQRLHSTTRAVHLRKPILPSELLDAVESAFGERGKEKEK